MSMSYESKIRPAFFKNQSLDESLVRLSAIQLELRTMAEPYNLPVEGNFKIFNSQVFLPILSPMDDSNVLASPDYGDLKQQQVQSN